MYAWSTVLHVVDVNVLVNLNSTTGCHMRQYCAIHALFDLPVII